jgi:hypothetical protein
MISASFFYFLGKFRTLPDVIHAEKEFCLKKNGKRKTVQKLCSPGLRSPLYSHKGRYGQ